MAKIFLSIQIISIIVIFFESVYIFKKWKTKVQGLLLLSCLATFVNNIGYLMELTAKNEGEYLLALKFSHVGKIWIPYTLLLFVVNLCIGRERKIGKIIFPFLGFIHSVTFFMIMYVERHDLYYKDMKYSVDGLFPHISKTNGAWYVFYQSIILSYVIFGILLLIVTAYKEKNAVDRKRLILVLISMIIQSAFFVLGAILNIRSYDITALGYTLGAIVTSIAIFKYNLMDTLQLARDYVIDEISEGIIVINQNNNIEYMNSVAKKLLGEKLYRSGGAVKDFLDAYIANDEPIMLYDRIYTPEKKGLSHGESYKGDAYVLVDDTEHYSYMERLKEQKELADKARVEAENASASKSAFLAVVSHEIRTPMNAVVGMANLLLKEPENLNDKQKKYLSNIKNSGDALVMIVNDILDQSKIEAGKMEIIDEPYELRSIVSDVKMIIENRIGTKPVHLITEVDDIVPDHLIGDGVRIRQILINLMNNAVKFTEKGYINLSIKGRLIEDSDSEKIALTFSVKDTGQGIRQEDLARLGQAFSQVDTVKNHGKEGTGLGLSISKDFIALMGGQLEVSSVYDEGSEFYFTINQGIGDNQIPEKVAYSFPGAKILIVDDTEINLMIMEEMLKPLGISVDTTISGEKAINMLSENKYDMIFMDYVMPILDGVETTERIREMGNDAQMGENEQEAEYYRSIPIIALTGDDSDETRERFKIAGIDDFTDKPVNMKKIEKMLVKWLPSGLIKQDVV